MAIVKSKPLPERFRENVARILREKEMYQVDLAELLDCHKSQISHVLTGRQIPTLDAVDRWARALRVDPKALLA